MKRDLGRVVVDEMPDTMMRYPAEFRPIAKGADGRLLARGEYPALAQADDVCELSFDAGSCRCFHNVVLPSTQAAGCSRVTHGKPGAGAGTSGTKMGAGVVRLGRILKNLSASAGLFKSR